MHCQYKTRLEDLSSLVNFVKVNAAFCASADCLLFSNDGTNRGLIVIRGSIGGIERQDSRHDEKYIGKYVGILGLLILQLRTLSPGCLG
jgi:hypothetical protein